MINDYDLTKATLNYVGTNHLLCVRAGRCFTGGTT